MDQQPSPAPNLLADAYHHLAHTLCATLGPPASDSPEDRRRRDHAAIKQVASLCPANAAEASLAAQYVAANAYTWDKLGEARAPCLDRDLAAKCAVQATGMFRQTQGAV